MPRPRKPYLTPRNHKGFAVVDMYDGDGKRRMVTLGPWGSPESDEALRRLRAERAASPVVPVAGPSAVSVNHVLHAFLQHAEHHYRRNDGTQTHEVAEYRLTARYVRNLYGLTPASEFGPLAMKAVRETFIKAGWARSLVNARVNRVRRVFKWAAGEELVGFEVYQRLTAVAGLQKGRTGVREAPPVGPVAAEHVRATLPYLLPEVAAMVEFQQLTGCRPGEVCAVRPCDIDATGKVWRYSPRQHKTGWRGKSRVVAIGPKAQAVLAPFTPDDPAAYYFSPRRAVERMHAARTAARVTPRYKSHMERNRNKRVAVPKRAPADRYDVSSYGHAVVKAVRKANRAYVEAGVEVESHVPQWSPNQLRHAHATEVRKRHGLEAAGAVLGHSRMSATEVYAERDAGIALAVAAEMG